MTEELWKHIESMDGWATREKCELIHGLVTESKPDLCVEIGVFGGRSLIAAADALRSNGRGVIYGIDPWEPGPALEGSNDKVNDDWWSKLDYKFILSSFIRWVLRLDLVTQCRWLHMMDVQAVRMFDPETIGYLHIDGNHSEEVGMRNFLQWSPLLKSGSYMIVDDTDWPSQKNTVKRIVNDPEFSVVKDYGNFMLFRKN